MLQKSQDKEEKPQDVVGTVLQNKEEYREIHQNVKVHYTIKKTDSFDNDFGNDVNAICIDYCGRFIESKCSERRIQGRRIEDYMWTYFGIPYINLKVLV